jgi:PAS domain-containing protein
MSNKPTDEEMEQKIVKLEKTSIYSEQDKEHLSLLLDNMPVIVYTCEAEGDFARTFISDSITEVTGYKPDDFISNASFWSDHIHPVDKPRINFLNLDITSTNIVGKLLMVHIYGYGMHYV